MMINVVDDIMGSGKTTWVLDYINNRRGTRFLCVVPTLSECKRYRENTCIRLIEPKAWGTKYQSLLNLIDSGQSIVTTHSLISHMDTEMMAKLREMDYVLIIDEALEVLSPYPRLSKYDKELIFGQRLVSLDNEGYITWQAEDYHGKFEEIKRLCENKALMTYRNSNGELAQPFIWNFPVDFFKCFEETYILTYMWEGSIQKSYFNIHGISYTKMMLDADNKNLIPYNRSLEMMKRKKVADLINVCGVSKWNRIGQRIGKSMPLSKSWYTRELKAHKKKKPNAITPIDIIKRNTRNFFRDSKAKDNMVTCHKKMWSSLRGEGYSGTKKNPCFVPCNARGMNDFAHKKKLAYLINFFLPADIKKFINYYKFKFDEDQYALSVLLQWIWRSQIRNGKPIDIYIPSERMRNLLCQWILDAKEYPTTKDGVA